MSVASVKMKDDLNWTEEQKGYILVSIFSDAVPERRHYMSNCLLHSLHSTGDTQLVKFLPLFMRSGMGRNGCLA